MVHITNFVSKLSSWTSNALFKSSFLTFQSILYSSNKSSFMKYFLRLAYLILYFPAFLPLTLFFLFHTNHSSPFCPIKSKCYILEPILSFFYTSTLEYLINASSFDYYLYTKDFQWLDIKFSTSITFLSSNPILLTLFLWCSSIH